MVIDTEGTEIEVTGVRNLCWQEITVKASGNQCTPHYLSVADPHRIIAISSGGRGLGGRSKGPNSANIPNEGQYSSIGWTFLFFSLLFLKTRKLH